MRTILTPVLVFLLACTGLAQAQEGTTSEDSNWRPPSPEELRGADPREIPHLMWKAGYRPTAAAHDPAVFEKIQKRLLDAGASEKDAWRLVEQLRVDQLQLPTPEWGKSESAIQRLQQVSPGLYSCRTPESAAEAYDRLRASDLQFQLDMRGFEGHTDAERIEGFTQENQGVGEHCIVCAEVYISCLQDANTFYIECSAACPGHPVCNDLYDAYSDACAEIFDDCFDDDCV